jgi:hypothetical protein
VKLGGSCLAVLLATLAACDAQVTPDYPGQKLVEIRGNIMMAEEAALLWWSPAGAPLATRVATEGAFPTSFTLSVYRTPPEGALFDLGSGAGLEVPASSAGAVACQVPPGASGRVAVAYVAAVMAGVPDDALAASVVGLSTDHALVYVAPDAPAAAPFLVPASGASLLPGYHLMSVEATDAAAAPAGALPCGPAPALRLRETQGGVAGTDIAIDIRPS